MAGAATLSIVTLNITTLSIMTLGMTTIDITMKNGALSIHKNLV